VTSDKTRLFLPFENAIYWTCFTVQGKRKSVHHELIREMGKSMQKSLMANQFNEEHKRQQIRASSSHWTSVH